MERKRKILISLIVVITIALVAVSACVGYSLGYANGLKYAVSTASTESNAVQQEGSVEEKAPEAESCAAAPVSEWYTVTTEKDPLNLRAEPRQSAKTLGKVPRGAYIEVTDFSDTWGNITYDGTNGWVNLSYCTKGDVEVAPLEEPSTETVYVTNTGECYHRDGCSYLRSRNPISLEDAKKWYRPCSRCNPPQ